MEVDKAVKKEKTGSSLTGRRDANGHAASAASSLAFIII